MESALVGSVSVTLDGRDQTVNKLNVTHHVRMEENAVHLATALVLPGGVEQDVTELNVGFTVSMGHA